MLAVLIGAILVAGAAVAGVRSSRSKAPLAGPSISPAPSTMAPAPSESSLRPTETPLSPNESPAASAESPAPSVTPTFAGVSPTGPVPSPTSLAGTGTDDGSFALAGLMLLTIAVAAGALLLRSGDGST